MALSGLDAVRLANGGISDPGQVGEGDHLGQGALCKPLKLPQVGSAALQSWSLVEPIGSMGPQVVGAGGPQNSQGALWRCSVARARETVEQSGLLVWDSSASEVVSAHRGDIQAQ